ncbi:pentatricopeptide repeat-containing protein At4g14050, mitochondrial-like [Selaginella moellendorffii]|nr:pentatricopeptide repeat-containing protein At4g14050, mitochondrial-like [Selaginella moellendorffii]|eukprot:XP_024534438.1 pentatricopeptide repeat-containing protein At4g14050, mitochondrial-like [Selaginella moellendorffii]
MVAAYALNGNVIGCRRLFDAMPSRDVVSWTAVITAFAHCGEGEKALDLFLAMALEGCDPNEVTFRSVLSACAYIGSVDRSRDFFLLVTGDFGIAPGRDHFVYMIDIFGRGGQLENAEELLRAMPFAPDALGGLRIER